MEIDKRDVNGILLLNKPLGFSSNKVLQKVKRLFNAKKAGHTGSLDPLATGLLAICFGTYTKISDKLLNSNKAYRVRCILGGTTKTGDLEGEVINKRSIEHIKENLVRQKLSEFHGEITQVPPMFSAIKHNGVPLYKLARKGKTVTRKERKVVIYSIELLEYRSSELLLSIECSKGTYIRTLITDLGELLGCGAYVSKLHRIKVGDYTEEMMVDLATLEKFVSYKDIDRLLIT